MDATQPISSTQVSPSADWFLQTLVNIVNDADGLELGIILQVGGGFVSGYLVGIAKYFEGFASDFSSAFQGTVSEQIRQELTNLGKIKPATENPDDAPLPNYIHLREARFYHPSGKPMPANRGVWWRGRVSEVSGFCIGSLTAES